MRVLSISVTEAGAANARRLPYEHVHGSAGDTIRARWSDVDAFVLFLATGAAVRIVAPLLGDKRTDPAVVCVDEAARFAIALVGGHEGGGNELAREVAAALNAEPVITTASEVGYSLGASTGGTGTGGDQDSGEFVLGVGTSSDADPEAVRALVEQTLAGRRVTEVATIDRRAEHPAITALCLSITVFSHEELAAVEVPTPSVAVQQAVGTPSVAEAAALLAAGPGAELVTPKQKNEVATAAVARRAPARAARPDRTLNAGVPHRYTSVQSSPAGRLSLVGLGPGTPLHRTPAATAAVRRADVVIGYGPYIDQCADLLTTAHEVVRSPIGDEVVRAKQAIAEAEAGKRVALVCSGDSGVYAMASIALELAPEGLDVEVVPGVTAALAAAAAVGAPLGHDHCSISLSDLLTPWPAIEKRIKAAAEADFVVAFYNPRSKGRDWQLPKALALLAEHRPRTTPVAIVRDAGRPGEQVTITTLHNLDPTQVDMTTCVVVGASTTQILNGRMVTPRGYDA